MPVARQDGIFPEHVVVGNRFAEPGPGGEVEVDNPGLVHVLHALGRHGVPVRVQVVDAVAAKGVEVVLIGGHGVQAIAAHPLQEPPGKIHFPQALAVEKQHAGVHIVVRVHPHILFNVTDKRADSLDRTVHHRTQQFAAHALAVQPGDIAGDHQVGIQADGFVPLGEELRNKEVEIPGERGNGAGAEFLHALKGVQALGERVELYPETLAGKAGDFAAVSLRDAVGQYMYMIG